MEPASSESRLQAFSARFLDFLTSLEPDYQNRHFLLAVSGGMDSMCMLALFKDLNVRFAVAHVNYGLRGADSDADAALVREMCITHQVSYHENHIPLNTEEPSDESLQQRGRRLRYTWFEELCVQFGYNTICTAHHQDDAAETFFINLLRGTGIKGLSGIPQKRDKIIRPMLCFTREEINEIVQLRNVPYRDDVSNFGRDYLRNRIRHDVLPPLKAERTQFVSKLAEIQRRLTQENALLEDYLASLKVALCKEHKGDLLINRESLMQATSPSVILEYILKPFGFTWTQCVSVITTPHRQGMRFLSATHALRIEREEIVVSATDMRAIKDTEQIIKGISKNPFSNSISPFRERRSYSADCVRQRRLRPPTAEELGAGAKGKNQEVFRDAIKGGSYLLPDGELVVQEEVAPASFGVDVFLEYIDASKLSAAFQIRHWQPGDFFYPYGGAGKKKLQDFFTDEKLSAIRKQNTWLLTEGENIVWVIGMRLDHRYRITDSTKDVLKLEWKPAED